MTYGTGRAVLRAMSAARTIDDLLHFPVLLYYHDKI